MDEQEWLHWDDLGFSVRVEYHSHRCDFWLYETVLYDDGVRRFSDENDRHCEADKAAVYLHGEVKWDGCSNWYFDECDRCMLHKCDRDTLKVFSELMLRCWDHTSQSLENFDG